LIAIAIASNFLGSLKVAVVVWNQVWVGDWFNIFLIYTSVPRRKWSTDTWSDLLLACFMYELSYMS